jgi:anti-anti-sigma regulatory factor
VISVDELVPQIWVDAEGHHGVLFLRVIGVLDGVTYRLLRDAVIKAALDEPRALIVDVEDLSVPSESAWSVFTSARWHVSIWPDVPILLVCARPERRQQITRCGVARYVPVYQDCESAVEAVADRSMHGRRRARTQLSPTAVSVGLARASVADSLTAWAEVDLIPVASTVATIFVENVLAHTDSAPVLIIESYRGTVTVAVEDGSPLAATLHEDAEHGAEVVSGLGIVAALCRAWGSTPMPAGKTVWAQVGRENRL